MVHRRSRPSTCARVLYRATWTKFRKSTKTRQKALAHSESRQRIQATTTRARATSLAQSRKKSTFANENPPWTPTAVKSFKSTLCPIPSCSTGQITCKRITSRVRARKPSNRKRKSSSNSMMTKSDSSGWAILICKGDPFRMFRLVVRSHEGPPFASLLSWTRSLIRFRRLGLISGMMMSRRSEALTTEKNKKSKLSKNCRKLGSQ